MRWLSPCVSTARLRWGRTVPPAGRWVSLHGETPLWGTLAPPNGTAPAAPPSPRPSRGVTRAQSRRPLGRGFLGRAAQAQGDARGFQALPRRDERPHGARRAPSPTASCLPTPAWPTAPALAAAGEGGAPGAPDAPAQSPRAGHPTGTPSRQHPATEPGTPCSPGWGSAPTPCSGSGPRSRLPALA